MKKRIIILSVAALLIANVVFITRAMTTKQVAQHDKNRVPEILKIFRGASEGRVLVARDNRLGTINVEEGSVLVDGSIALNDYGILIGGTVQEPFAGTGEQGIYIIGEHAPSGKEILGNTGVYLKPLSKDGRIQEKSDDLR